jgi:hypothetical protein
MYDLPIVLIQIFIYKSYNIYPENIESFIQNGVGL